MVSRLIFLLFLAGPLAVLPGCSTSGPTARQMSATCLDFGVAAVALPAGHLAITPVGDGIAVRYPSGWIAFRHLFGADLEPVEESGAALQRAVARAARAINAGQSLPAGNARAVREALFRSATAVLARPLPVGTLYRAQVRQPEPRPAAVLVVDTRRAVIIDALGEPGTDGPLDATEWLEACPGAAQ